LPICHHRCTASGHPAASAEARIFPVDTNFQRMARRPGGVTRNPAMERAETKIAEVRVDFNKWLMESWPNSQTRLRWRANGRSIRSGSPTFPTAAGSCATLPTMRFELLSFVAASLCDLLDSINVKDEFPVDTTVCHLNSLTLAARLQFRGLRPEQAPDLTKGLRLLVRMLAVSCLFHVNVY
jgi:hypothetical protein